MAVSGTGSTRANFGDLLEPGFRKIFFDYFAQLPTVYDKIFNVSSSTRQQEYDSSVTGFGTLVETSEGAPITYEDPKFEWGFILKSILKNLRNCGKLLRKTIRSQAREIKKISGRFRDYNASILTGNAEDNGIVRTATII